MADFDAGVFFLFKRDSDSEDFGGREKALGVRMGQKTTNVVTSLKVFLKVWGKVCVFLKCPVSAKALGPVGLGLSSSKGC